MYAPKYRLEAIETIGRKILLEYDRTLLEGPPQAIPVETIIETKFNLTLEYHTLRKNGSVLGETIFDDGAAILYDRTERQYRLIAVKAGTILIDERLCILQELRQCLAQLPLEEQNLIRALYFEELTEREYAKQINISQKAVNKRRHKILSKLRALMKIK